MDLPILMTVLMGGEEAFTLPYSADFSVLPDGALPSRFVGATGSNWSVATGKAINSPTEGDELVTNGTMEAGDPVTGWTGNVATNASVADERTGGAGSKSMEVTVSAAYGSMRQVITAAKGAWLKTSLWYKKGTSNGIVTCVGFNLPSPSDVAWANYLVHGYVSTPNPIVGGGCATNLGTSRYDDISSKVLTGVFTGFEAPANLAIVKATVTLTARYIPIGVFMCGNSETPTSGVFASIQIYSGNFISVKMWKLVNTTLTADLVSVNIAQVAGALLEIRRTAPTTFQVWYNGTQRGADITISDAGIISNLYAGILSTGGTGNSISAFFLD